MTTERISMDLLRHGRAKHRRMLTSKNNVVGTMLGVKLTEGAPVHTRSIIVAVRRKKPLSKLKSEDRIPKYVLIRGARIPVDVIALGALVPQQFTRPLACSDKKSRATVSAIAATPAGPVGVTCAHALKGLDDDIFTPDPVGLYSSQLNSYLPVGRSGLVVYSPGLGVSGDYGFSDAGTFTLDETAASELSVGLKPLTIWSAPAVNAAVQATSVHGLLRGQIHAVQAELFDAYCDFIVRMDDVGTFGGDSGLLWRTSSGAGVGIHAWGSEEASNRGSEYSVCMFAGRVSRMLGVTLLDTP